MILFVDILFRDTCSIYLTADVWKGMCIQVGVLYVWQLVSAALSLAQSVFLLQILRLEKKPWRKTMGKEAWKKAKAPEVELSGSLAWT